MADIITPVTGGGNLFQPIDFVAKVNGVYGVLLYYLALIAGAVVLVYIIAGGIKYMQAGADQKQATMARAMIVNAVVGAAIIIGTYTLISIGISIATLFNGLESGPLEFQNTTGGGAGTCISVAYGDHCSSRDNLGTGGGQGCTCQNVHAGFACSSDADCVNP
jgi:hypothetical protein